MKKVFALLLLVLAPVFSYAQFTRNSLRDSTVVVNDTIDTDDGQLTIQKTTKITIVQLNNFNDNWFFSVGVGPHIYRGENEWKMRLQDYMVPSIDASIGKWFSPSIGGDFMLSFAKFKGVWQVSNRTLLDIQESRGCSYDEALRIASEDYNFVTFDRYSHSPNRPEELLFKQKGYYLNAYLRVMFDMSTIIGGYKPDRKNHIIPYIGAGYVKGIGNRSSRAGSPSFNRGVMYDYRFNNVWSFNATARAALLGDSFDGEYTPSRTGDGTFGVTVGFTYHFGKKYWDRVKEENVAYKYDKKVKVLEKKVEDQQVEMVRIAEEAEVQKERMAGTLFPYYVNFALDDFTLVNREKVNLSVISRVMKENPQTTYVISGYADKQTGTAERNQWLSENRSKQVAQVLVDEFGVDPKQLELESNGGVGSMYYDESALSRCVVISIKK